MAPLSRLLIATLGMLFSIIITSTAMSQGQRNFEIVENADYYGFDLRSERDISLEQCQATCAGDDQCRAFTYNKKAQWCFLKSDFGMRMDAPGAIAGHIIEASQGEDIGAPAKLTFLPEDIVNNAREFRRATETNVPDESAGLQDYISSAMAAAHDNDPTQAARYFGFALHLAPKDARLWIGLARARL